MPDRLCPLREAALDAPRQIGVPPFTFSELDQEADRFAFRLSELGVKPGERIALFHPPHPSLISFFFAAWRVGATLCPLNLRLPPSQIPLHLERLKPALFISSLSQIGPKMNNTKPSPETSLLLFTSGSTGTPKIAALSWKNLISNATEAASFLDLKPGDQWRLTLPLFHVGGIGILFRCLLARASIVLEDSPGITHLSYVPTHLYRSTPVYKNLRCLLLGGAPIPSYPSHLPCYLSYGLTEMSSLVTARFCPPSQEGHFYLGHPLKGREMKISSDGEIYVRGDCLFQGYWEEENSSLEAGLGLSKNKVKYFDSARQSQIEAAISSAPNERDHCLKSKAPGSPTMHHRWGGSEEDRFGKVAASQNALDYSLTVPWFATGDLGKYSPEDGFAIIGRKDEQFISGGENIQPEEIERALLQIPGILEAAVVGIPDVEFGRRPAAAIRSLDSQFSREKMESALIHKLPKYKIPISLLILDELPKTGSKIDRKKILNLFLK